MFHINNFFSFFPTFSHPLNSFHSLSPKLSSLSTLSSLSRNSLPISLGKTLSHTSFFSIFAKLVAWEPFQPLHVKFFKIGGLHVIDLWRYKEELVIGGSQRVEDSRNWASSKRTGHGNDPRGSHDHGWCIIVYLLI